MNCVHRVLGYVPTNVGGQRPDGLVLVSIGEDGHFYVDGDYSGALSPLAVVDAYVKAGVDCLVTGVSGKDLEPAAENIYGLMMEDVVSDARPKGGPGTLNLKRCSGPYLAGDIPMVAELYKQGRIHHVIGVDLSELERELTALAAGKLIPAAVRALTIAVVELSAVAPTTLCD